METTTLTALVVAAHRDDETARPLDGPWATEARPRLQARGARAALAAVLVALAARLAPTPASRRPEADAPLAAASTD